MIYRYVYKRESYAHNYSTYVQHFCVEVCTTVTGRIDESFSYLHVVYTHDITQLLSALCPMACFGQNFP